MCSEKRYPQVQLELCCKKKKIPTHKSNAAVPQENETKLMRRVLLWVWTKIPTRLPTRSAKIFVGPQPTTTLSSNPTVLIIVKEDCNSVIKEIPAPIFFICSNASLRVVFVIQYPWEKWRKHAKIAYIRDTRLRDLATAGATS